jgi:hypothetical protein
MNFDINQPESRETYEQHLIRNLVATFEDTINYLELVTSSKTEMTSAQKSKTTKQFDELITPVLMKIRKLGAKIKNEKYILILSEEAANYLNWIELQTRSFKADAVRNSLLIAAAKHKEYQDYLKKKDN